MPQSGRIYWDDADVLATDQRRLRDAIGVLFQDYARWAMMARDGRYAHMFRLQAEAYVDGAAT